jgi:hypothetical protein
VEASNHGIKENNHIKYCIHTSENTNVRIPNVKKLEIILRVPKIVNTEYV